MLKALATAYVEAFIGAIARKDPDAALFAQLDAIEDCLEEQSERFDALLQQFGVRPILVPLPVADERTIEDIRAWREARRSAEGARG